MNIYVKRLEAANRQLTLLNAELKRALGIQPLHPCVINFTLHERLFVEMLVKFELVDREVAIVGVWNRVLDKPGHQALFHVVHIVRSKLKKHDIKVKAERSIGWYVPVGDGSKKRLIALMKRRP